MTSALKSGRDRSKEFRQWPENAVLRMFRHGPVLGLRRFRVVAVHGYENRTGADPGVDSLEAVGPVSVLARSRRWGVGQ